MKAAPGFFCDCTMVIDRVHQPGHVRCDPAFCMHHYKERMVDICSQIAEQTNAEMERSDQKGSLAHMGHFNFMLSFRLSMFMSNLRSMRTRLALPHHTSFMALVAALRVRDQHD